MWTLADIGGVRQGAADLVWKERGYEFLRRARSFKTRTLSHLWTLKCLHIVQSHYIIPINHLTSRTPSNQNNLLIIAQAGALISTKIIIYGFEACFIFIQYRSNTVQCVGLFVGCWSFRTCVWWCQMILVNVFSAHALFVPICTCFGGGGGQWAWGQRRRHAETTLS